MERPSAAQSLAAAFQAGLDAALKLGAESAVPDSARLIAEAKAKKEAAAAAAAQGEASGGSEAPPPPGGKSPEVGDPLKSPSQADLERAAKIAEAKARAAAAKEAAAKAQANDEIQQLLVKLAQRELDGQPRPRRG